MTRGSADPSSKRPPGFGASQVFVFLRREFVNVLSLFTENNNNALFFKNAEIFDWNRTQQRSKIKSKRPQIPFPNCSTNDFKIVPKRSKKRSRNGPRAHRQPREATGTTKSSRESPQTAQASQRHLQGWHQHAKETTEAPKERQKKPKSLQKRTKNDKKTRKREAGENLVFKNRT